MPLVLVHGVSPAPDPYCFLYTELKLFELMNDPNESYLVKFETLEISYNIRVLHIKTISLIVLCNINYVLVTHMCLVLKEMTTFIQSLTYLVQNC